MEPAEPPRDLCLVPSLPPAPPCRQRKPQRLPRAAPKNPRQRTRTAPVPSEQTQCESINLGKATTALHQDERIALPETDAYKFVWFWRFPSSPSGSAQPSAGTESHGRANGGISTALPRLVQLISQTLNQEQSIRITILYIFSSRLPP